MTEFVRRMFVKETIDVVKLIQPHPKFREFSTNIQDKIRKPKAKIQDKNSKQDNIIDILNNETEIPKENS